MPPLLGVLAFAAFLAACSERFETPDLPSITRPVPAEQSRAVRLVAVGDILLADAVQDHLDKSGYDFPFLHLTALIPDHDILLGNLEGPITAQATPISGEKAFVYKADVRAVSSETEDAG